MFLYIHGFASSSKSNKVTLLKKYFKNIESIDLEPEPNLAIKQLETFIENYSQTINITLIGSSLGGYYTMYLSEKYNLKSVLINPSIFPAQTLKNYENLEVANYSTNESFVFKSSYLKQLENYRTARLDSSKILLLLQTGDEVIDYKKAVEFLPDAKIIIETGGSHQFDGFENYFKIIESFTSEILCKI